MHNNLKIFKFSENKHNKFINIFVIQIILVEKKIKLKKNREVIKM